MQDRKKKNPVHCKLKFLESIMVHLHVQGWEQLECSVTLWNCSSQPFGYGWLWAGAGTPHRSKSPSKWPCWEQDCPSCTQLQHVCRLCSRSAVVTWGCLGQLAEVAVKAFFPYFFSELRVFWVTQPSYTPWYMCVVLQLLFAGNAHALHALREKGQKRVSPSALLFNMSQGSASVLLKSACKF